MKRFLTGSRTCRKVKHFHLGGGPTSPSINCGLRWNFLSMSVPHTHVVLAISDPALRTMLAAELGLAGEVLISTSSHLNSNLSASVRAKALLVIEQCLIASGATDWAEELRQNNWTGRAIAVVDSGHGLSHDDEEIYFVCRHNAAAATLELVLKWKLQAA